jgi:hypothetical protein
LKKASPQQLDSLQLNSILKTGTLKGNRFHFRGTRFSFKLSAYAMKKALILFLVCPLLSLAQTTEYGSFKIVDTELIYQKIFFADTITNEKLANFMKSVPELKNVSIAGSEVTADLSELVVDYQKFQFSQVAVPPIIQTGRYSGKVAGEAKDGKYRITVRSIQMKGDIGYKRIAQPENLSNYATQNSGTILHREWCKPNTLGLLDKALSDKFIYKEARKDSDW